MPGTRLFKPVARFTAAMAALVAFTPLAAQADAAPTDDPGLLFYLSADKGLVADEAQGEAVPNFASRADIVPTGVTGGALQTQDDVVLSWMAPGNIYAQRGSLSFFWRSRYPVGEAPFPLFRVGYADHTSWDMVWLRIDWNGDGFDAFVTDDNLARTRVSFKLPRRPAADAWTHLAFTWDETKGVRLYVDGKPAARQDATGVWDTGLDQFGPTGRVVSPHQVQSRYNFMRGGDYDELRIYDHMLDDAEVAALARNQAPAVAAPVHGLDDPATEAEWRLRWGWNRKDAPPALTAPSTRIRKVEFADAKDLKEWMWKATDGIAETTWPGVYNRSRLPGRSDYFDLPDWNVYVEGGKALTLTLPDDTWNTVQIQGAAYGDLSWAPAAGSSPVKLAARPKGQERTVTALADTRRGGILTFTNQAQETPIQEITAFDISVGAEPEGSAKLSYTIRASAAADNPNLADLNRFIAGRYPAQERSTVVALPEAAPSRPRPLAADPAAPLPLVHVLIPYEFGSSPAGQPLYRSWGYGWENMHDGLDGIAIDLPALKVAPTHGELYPINIQVKDPLWPARNLIDVSVSVRPGEARTVWLDTRDRILPNASLYLTLAGAGPGLDAAALDGTRIRLVFKDRSAALPEHIADRFNQVKDNWGFLVEEHTASRREALLARLTGDMGDLLRVDPDNRLAREYWADITYGNQEPLPWTAPQAPAGMPKWAFLQLEDLKRVRHFVNWWIDNRQSDYGDFGGGISDDTDLTQQWPGLALMGVDPEKIRVSQMRLADAAHRNGMFAGGLSAITLDELHAYEDGINSDSEALYLNWGDPKVVERLMQTVAAYDRIIMVNPNGHLHFASNWYSGTKVYREGPWEWGKYYSYLVLHPGVLLGAWNGDPTGRRFVIGLADGLLAHGRQDKDGAWLFPDEINWRTDAERGALPASSPPMQLMWAAWRWTGDAKYLRPILAAEAKGGTKAISDLNENAFVILGQAEARGAEVLKAAGSAKATGFDRYLAWQVSGDKGWLEALYSDEIRAVDRRMYMQTEGHWWTDRVELSSELLQRTRLGGVALKRNQLYPGHLVSWRFADDGDALAVAILVRGDGPGRFKVIAYNSADHAVKLQMTPWGVEPGTWSVVQGADGDGDDRPDGAGEAFKVVLQKSRGQTLEFAPGRTTVLDFRLDEADGSPETRPDLGIGPDDVTRSGRKITVTIHSLGAAATPAGTVSVLDAAGEVVAFKPIPPLEAPRDLKPRTVTITLSVSATARIQGGKVRIAAADGAPETTLNNNEVSLP